MYQPFISALYSATLRLVSPVLLIPVTYYRYWFSNLWLFLTL